VRDSPSPWASSFAAPLAVGLDPLRTVRRWGGEREIENRERLLRATAPADRNDLLATVQLDALDRNGDSEDHRFEGTARLSAIIVNQPVICSESL